MIISSRSLRDISSWTDPRFIECPENMMDFDAHTPIFCSLSLKIILNYFSGHGFLVFTFLMSSPVIVTSQNMGPGELPLNNLHPITAVRGSMYSECLIDVFPFHSIRIYSLLSVLLLIDCKIYMVHVPETIQKDLVCIFRISSCLSPKWIPRTREAWSSTSRASTDPCFRNQNFSACAQICETVMGRTFFWVDP